MLYNIFKYIVVKCSAVKLTGKKSSKVKYTAVKKTAVRYNHRIVKDLGEILCYLIQ